MARNRCHRWDSNPGHQIEKLTVDLHERCSRGGRIQKHRPVEREPVDKYLWKVDDLNLIIITMTNKYLWKVDDLKLMIITMTNICGK